MSHPSGGVPVVYPAGGEKALQHVADFRFFPWRPAAITLWMYAAASGTLQSVSPASTVTAPTAFAVAVAAGVNLIDVKDPARGPLGPDILDPRFAAAAREADRKLAVALLKAEFKVTDENPKLDEKGS
jgi:hypothetical protein